MREAIAIDERGMPHSMNVDAGAAIRTVIEGVIELLEAGRLAPGQRLIESQLCERFGVGRNTVREGLQRLAAEGIVELHRNRGACVRELSLEEAIQTLEVTELLTGLAARSAARRIGDDGAQEQMKSALRALDQAHKDGDLRSFVRARRMFFNSLISIGGNRELQRILATIHVHVLRAQFQLTDIQRHLLADFRAIGQAVLSGEPAQAEQLARRYVRRLRASMITLQSPEHHHG